MAGLAPLPSFIRASAQDAANAQMRKAGRSAWSDDDYNLACDTQERLVRSCYGRPGDHNEPRWCFIRFQVAERLERAGEFGLKTDLATIAARIDEILDGAPR